MKVLLSAFACAPYRGSEPGVGWNWAMALAKYNDVVVLTREENRREIEDYKKENCVPFQVEYFGIPFFEKNTKIPFQKNLYTMQWQRKVVEFAEELNRKYKFDVCHHVTYASYKYPTELYKLGVPLIVGPVGGGEVTPQSCRATYGLKDNLIESIHDLQIKSTIHSRKFKNMCENASMILTTTQETFDCIPETYKNKVKIMQTIGISEEEIRTESVEREYGCDKKFKVLYVGNLLPLKGVQLLPEIAQVLNDKDILFQIVGTGIEEKRMKRFISKHGLKENFQFVGAVPRNKVLEYMDNAHMFVFPSYHDSGAMVILEAMARELPVLAMETGGPAVHIQDGRGMAVNPNQSIKKIVNEFANDIKFCKGLYDSDREKIKEITDCAKKYLYLDCEWDNKAKIMQNFYREVVEKSQL